MVDSTAIVGALEDAGYRLTSPRRAVAELIGGKRGHFTADDSSRIRGAPLGLTRATVFRSRLLADLGFIDASTRPSGSMLRACGRPHHHHLGARVGSTTGSTTTPQRVAAAIARQSGYRVDITARLSGFVRCRSRLTC